MTDTQFVPPTFAETVDRLAIGVEVRDALSGNRFPHPAVVLDEAHPAPLHQWRRWPVGLVLDDVLTRLDRHRSGRFARCYRDQRAVDITLRITEPRPAGRRLVPRRLAVQIATEAVVSAAEAPGGTGHPLWRRVFPVTVHPGAAASLPAGAAAVRGVVARPGPDGVVRPVRWARVEAVDVHGDVVGWAHGDDRGEFVLAVGAADVATDIPPDPQDLDLTVSVPPAVVIDPDDVLLTERDPLWDLPVETLTAAVDAADQPAFTGRRHWPGTAVGPFPVVVALRRPTSVVIDLPG